VAASHPAQLHHNAILGLTAQSQRNKMGSITHLQEAHAMILVTTAGKVGAEAVRLLALREVPVRVLVRDPDKARALADAGAEIAVRDLDVPASLDAAMAGVKAVILVSPAVPAQELNVVASAARAGVGHVVKATSKASADSPIARRR
jgi:uncharacterized protein YbjT (DUF2867 family)